jgi:hypothetical protein
MIKKIINPTSYFIALSIGLLFTGYLLFSFPLLIVIGLSIFFIRLLLI